MKLSVKSVTENAEEWEDKGYALPKYDIPQMRRATRERPEWVHFGAGNIFRAFPAVLCQELLNRGLIDTGIIAVEGYDFEAAEILKESEGLSIAVTLNSDGARGKTVTASIAETLCLDFENRDDTRCLKEIFASDTLRAASFTITEKGYAVTSAEKDDFKRGPSSPKTYMGRVAALLYYRYLRSGMPITLISMDNCSKNGEKLKQACTAFAEAWIGLKLADIGFREYLKTKVAYPCSMIDKITPRPSPEVCDELRRDGIENMKIRETKRHTFAAPFVNAERTQYLVIEDAFASKKLPLDRIEGSGAVYASAETVERAERMKVCTCLNPLHTCLAVFGCLLGYTKISDEMSDKRLSELVKGLAYGECLPVSSDPGIISPRKFLDEVICERLGNPYIPDTPQRIACDTSRKLSVRFGVTIKRYMDMERSAELKYIPAVLAAWCRYLLGIDDRGHGFEPSPDPMLEQLRGTISRIGFCQADRSTVHEGICGLLSDDEIFGVNLYDALIGERCEKYFIEMNRGIGAVGKFLNSII